MAVEYYHRGGHYIDLDYHVEGEYIKHETCSPQGKIVTMEWCCWEHLTDEEQEKLENE